MKKNSGVFRRMIALSGIIMLSGILACSKSSNTTNPVTPPSTGNNTVSMVNTAFSPASLTVAAGTTVTWTNNDAMTHTVTSGTPSAPDGTFDSCNMGTGATFHYTFATKGTYQYFCRVHAATMKATVVVQ
jgi:manganese oxidase